MAERISIIIPVHNELESLPELLRRVEQVMRGADFAGAECLVVDDASTDGSAEWLEEARRRYPFLQPVYVRQRGGKSAALCLGMQQARGDIFMMLDGDLQNDPLELPLMLQALRAGGYDLLTGWRSTRRDVRFKRVASQGYNWLMNTLFRMRLHDHNCGMKVFRAGIPGHLRLDREWHRFLTVLAHYAGYRVGEMPVTHHPRAHGRSRYGFGRYVQFGKDALILYARLTFTGRRWERLKALAPLLVLYLLGWCIYRDYGITWDEPLHMDRPDLYFHTWQMILQNTRFEIDGAMRYGPLMNLLAHPFIVLGAHRPYNASPEAYAIKHLLTFHFALAGYVALAVALRRTLAISMAWCVGLSVLVLALHPSFFGHGFYNPKDIPFAVLYTLGSVALGLRVPVMLGAMQRRDASAAMREGVVVGMIIGFCCGVRIAAIVLLPSWLLLAGTGMAMRRPDRHDMTYLAAAGASAFGISMMAIVLFYPSIINDVFYWFVDTALYFSTATGKDDICRLIDGVCTYHINRFYLPLHLAIKSPLLFLALGIIGIVLFLRRLGGFTPQGRCIGLMLLMQMLWLPAWIILTNTPLYDTDRHLLFIYPALGFFSALALVLGWRLLSARPRLRAVLAALMALQALHTARDMVRLHPYETAYFNELVRPGHINGRWESDYWGLSARPLMRWMNEHVPVPTLIIGQPYTLMQVYAAPRFKIVPPWEAEQHARPYYVAFYRREENYGQYYADCPVVYRETRYLGNEEIEMGSIRRCDARPGPAPVRMSVPGPVPPLMSVPAGGKP